MLIFIMYCYVYYHFQIPAVHVLYFAFEINLNWPYANDPIAPPFKFVRVYFTKAPIVTKRTCICLSDVSTVLWLVKAYFDLQVATGQLATVTQSYLFG